MAKWLKQNLNLAIIISIIAYGMGGVAVAAVMRSDIDRLKQQMEDMPTAITRLETNDANQDKVINRIDGNVSILINRQFK